MSNIHKPTEAPLPGEVDAEVVAAVERLLGRVQRGETVAVAVAEVHPNHDVSNGWEGAGGTMHEMVSAIASLQFAFMMWMFANREEAGSHD